MFHTIVIKHKFLLLCVILLSAMPILAVAKGITFEKATLSIVSGEQRHVFKVELATTPAQQERGLMFRKSLADDAGMLFVLAQEQPISMWMKNTLIPLDMVFINKQGTITHIHANAKPKSLATISSNGPVYAVLELAGGVSKKKQIKVGDVVEYAAFGSATH